MVNSINTTKKPMEKMSEFVFFQSASPRNQSFMRALLLGNKIWLVEPTPLKNMLVKLGSSSPIFGMKIKKYLKPPPRDALKNIHHDTDLNEDSPM